MCSFSKCPYSLMEEDEDLCLGPRLCHSGLKMEPQFPDTRDFPGTQFPLQSQKENS